MTDVLDSFDKTRLKGGSFARAQPQGALGTGWGGHTAIALEGGSDYYTVLSGNHSDEVSVGASPKSRSLGVRRIK